MQNCHCVTVAYRVVIYKQRETVIARQASSSLPVTGGIPSVRVSRHFSAAIYLKRWTLPYEVIMICMDG